MAKSGRARTAAKDSPAELGRDLLWWLLHSLIALALLAATIALISLSHPDQHARESRLLGTAAAFVVPFLVGLALGRARSRDRRAWPARYVWVAGLLWFAVLALWVRGAPLLPQACDACGANDKIVRTLFVIDRGTGLLDGNGLLFGAWMPLAALGYSSGAALGMRL